MGKLLNDEIIRQVKDLFDSQLKNPVEILFFGKQVDCDYCEDTLRLVEEIVAISGKLDLRRYDLTLNDDIARDYHVDKTPGLVIAAREGDAIIDYGIRLAGVPSGHEFNTLIHDLILVSGRDSGLSQNIRDELKNLKEKVHLQVFVTPTCPYCPRAVLVAHQMAMESTWVEAEMVEAMEFPDLADQFKVSGVPQTTINYGAGTVIGAVAEYSLWEEIKKSLNAIAVKQL